jgi:hypothetical protein
MRARCVRMGGGGKREEGRGGKCVCVREREIQEQNWEGEC